jgi:hypothetical protein
MCFSLALSSIISMISLFRARARPVTSHAKVMYMNDVRPRKTLVDVAASVAMGFPIYYSVLSDEDEVVNDPELDAASEPAGREERRSWRRVFADFIVSMFRSSVRVWQAPADL